jgi:hypothetical protein
MVAVTAGTYRPIAAACSIGDKEVLTVYTL